MNSKWDVLHHLAVGSLVEVPPEYAVEPQWSVSAARNMARRVRLFTDVVEEKIAALRA